MSVEGQWCGHNGSEVVTWHGFVPRTRLRSRCTSQAWEFLRVCFVG